VITSFNNDTQFGTDTRTFSGCLADRLTATKRAGFKQIMLWRADLEEHPEGVDRACDIVRESGLRVTGMQLIRDMESGVSGDSRQAKLREAESLCQLSHRVGAPLVLCCSSVAVPSGDSPEVMARDLRELAHIAHEHRIGVAYEALSWGTHINTIGAAANLVERVDHPAFGLAIDSFHLLARNTPLEALNEIDIKRVFLVQLADYRLPALSSNAERIDIARHHRLFPGEGLHGAFSASVVTHLREYGYTGAFSLEVINDAFQATRPADLAIQARNAVEAVFFTS